MTFTKPIALALVVFFIAYIGGLFGPGPLIAGLGPLLDQIATLALILVAAVVVTPLLLRFFRKSGSGDSNPINSPAEQILRERYARGELDRHQFLLMVEDLRMLNPRRSALPKMCR